MIHLSEHGHLARELGGLAQDGGNDEAALGIGLHLAAEVGGGLQELALGGAGRRKGRQAGLDGLPDRQRVEAGGPAVQGGQVVPKCAGAFAQSLSPLALGEGFELGLEGRGELQSSLLVHRGR